MVIKKGDAALADVIEKGCTPVGKHVKKTTVEDIKNMERDYNIMRISHNEKIKKAMALRNAGSTVILEEAPENKQKD